jgi:hypothetical protein
MKGRKALYFLSEQRLRAMAYKLKDRRMNWPACLPCANWTCRTAGNWMTRCFS